jgi:hypothetical protein
MSIALLIDRQNPDGGWPYVRGASWTEPTAYAILALQDAGETGAAARGVAWLRSTQRADGGWAPQVGVDRSTWVTALVALLPPELLGEKQMDRSIAWLAHTSGAETSANYRLRQWLLGNPTPPEQQFRGWPWVPGAAAWVGPTSLAMLAMHKAALRKSTPELADRIDSGRRFLLGRVCQEGGWNHGSAQALGYGSHPYPETTGMALTALRGVSSPLIERSVLKASAFLRETRSADAINWLRLGLGAHERLPRDFSPPATLVCRNLSEVGLGLLASGERMGKRTFWA